MKKKNPVGTVLIYLFLLLMSVLVIFPLYIMVAGSLKFPQDLAAHSWQLPSPVTLNNFRRLLSYNAGTIVRTYANSLFITAAHTAIVILLGSLAAFAFSKYRFAGRRTLFVLLLATMMIPFELCATPLYIIFSKINWLNTYQIQIIHGQRICHVYDEAVHGRHSGCACRSGTSGRCGPSPHLVERYDARDKAGHQRHGRIGRAGKI